MARPRHGLVVRNDAKSITFLLEGGGEQTVAVESLTRLDISISKKRQTLKGAIIGTAAGVALGFVMTVNPQNCGLDSVNFCSRGEAVGGGALTGLLGGTLIGAFVQTDRWTPVDLGTWKRGTTPVARTARTPLSLQRQPPLLSRPCAWEVTGTACPEDASPWEEG